MEAATRIRVTLCQLLVHTQYGAVEAGLSTWAWVDMGALATGTWVGSWEHA